MNISKKIKKFFHTKTVTIVSEDGISRHTLNPFSQITIIFFIFSFFCINVINFQYLDSIRNKDMQISSLSQTNEHLSFEVSSLDNNVSNINNYFESISQYLHVDEVRQKNIALVDNKLFHSASLKSEDNSPFKTIASSRNTLNEIKESVSKRISKLETVIETTGITKKKNRDEKTTASLKYINFQESGEYPYFYSGKGEGNEEIADFGEYKEVVLSTDGEMNDNIKYLQELEEFVNYIPLSTPIIRGRYYVSSSYGTRVDPITHQGISFHYGTDFVAYKRREDILSPAAGKVVYAGSLGTYGNIIKINHLRHKKTKISTIYAHLSKIHVKRGDKIKSGQIIASQGNTGRSTGPHLHYEIRVNNKPVNPYKFFKAHEVLDS